MLNVINMLVEIDMIYLFIAEIISADNNLTNDQINENIKKLESIEAVMNDPNCKMDDKTKETVIQSKKMLESELA